MSQLNFKHQLKSLNAQCMHLLKQDGIFSHGQFYNKLDEFITYYDKTRTYLKDHFIAKDEKLHEHIEALPEIEFKDYNTTRSWKSVLSFIGLMVFFPIGILHLVNKHRYVNRVKNKLRKASRAISSIEFHTNTSVN